MGSQLDDKMIDKLQKKFETLLNKQVNSLSKAHKQQLKNVEAVTLAEASKFIKNHAEKIARALTREHHKIIQQFLDYKDRIDYFINGLNEAQTRMVTAEMISALKNQIYEAEYATSEDNPLKLFDCLVPKLKEHRKAKKEPVTVDELR